MMVESKFLRSRVASLSACPPLVLRTSRGPTQPGPGAAPSLTRRGAEFPRAGRVPLRLPVAPAVLRRELDLVDHPGVGQRSHLVVFLPIAVVRRVVGVAGPHVRLAVAAQVVAVRVVVLSALQQVAGKATQLSYRCYI